MLNKNYTTKGYEESTEYLSHTTQTARLKNLFLNRDSLKFTVLAREKYFVVYGEV